MKPLTLVLFLLTFVLPLGLAQGGGPGEDLDPIIGDFLEGSSDLEEKLQEATASYQGPPCTIKPGYDGLAIRQLYDTLVWVGEILCKLGINCFTRYIKDFFPLPTGTDALIASTQNAGQALFLGRWYHLYEPLGILLQHYKEQKDLKGLTAAEGPSALLVYPDLAYGEFMASKGIWGDKDLLKGVREGRLVGHLPYPPGSFDRINLGAIDAGELARALLTELAPGVLLYVPRSQGSPIRTFIVLGSTAPKGAPTAPTPIGCSPKSPEGSSASYWELVGRVPYFWSTAVGSVLPAVQALASFAEAMERKEEEIKKGENVLHGK